VTEREKRRSAPFRLAKVHLDWMREPAAGSRGRAGWVRIELASHAAKRYIALGDLTGKKVGTQKELSLTTAEAR
jgi:hypothetical protein